MKLEFKNQDEALRWVAKMNEMSFRFEVAAKLYRQSGDEEDAQRCDDMAQRNADLSCKQIEVDEIWGFVGAKQKNARKAGAYGDVWTFIALDSETKLIPCFISGKRDAYHAKAFMADLASRVKNRVQISSDALKAYEGIYVESYPSRNTLQERGLRE